MVPFGFCSRLAGADPGGTSGLPGPPLSVGAPFGWLPKPYAPHALIAMVKQALAAL